MTDDLIARLSSELKPVPRHALERRLLLSLLAGLIVTGIASWLILHMMLGRPFGGAFGGPIFWVKLGYTAAFGLFGLAAAPVLTRPDGRILWPLLVSGLLVLLALAIGTMDWMRADWSMPVLIGQTAMVCPWLITLTGLPILAMLLIAMRGLAPASTALAGFAAGLVAGGFGALVYAFYCGETGMMFMAVWYTLGMAMTALLGAITGKILLRW